jgi:serine protease Do
MGLATDLIRFFLPLNSPLRDNIRRPWAISDFLQEHPQYNGNVFELNIACNRLSAEGFLNHVGNTGAPFYGDCYYSMMTARVTEERVTYGFFEFLVFGFPLIRNHFEKSVLPLSVVTRKKGEDSIGSGFLIDSNRFVTATHCVKGKDIKKIKTIQIPGWNPATAKLNSIYIPTDERIDLAVLTFEADPFPDAPKFKMQSFNVLDEVLSMGYPPIPGFQDLLVSETGRVAGYLKSTVGQVVTRAESYLDRQDKILISARVKGGNSGGPVVGKTGEVIGVVTAVPGDNAVTDTLGYGIAIPYDETVKNFLEQVQSQTNKVQSLSCEVIGDKITMLER